MIGIVIVTHGQFGAELLKAAELVLGSKQKCQIVGIEMNISGDYLLDQVGKAISQQDTGDGVLILSDMFGGTPSNISLSYFEPHKIEILFGVNLPMLLKSLEYRRKGELDLSNLQPIVDCSRKAIKLASAIMNK
jgi:PTS system mannose-specific IIA component